jgi:hypothetical protein
MSYRIDWAARRPAPTNILILNRTLIVEIAKAGCPVENEMGHNSFSEIRGHYSQQLASQNRRASGDDGKS